MKKLSDLGEKEYKKGLEGTINQSIANLIGLKDSFSPGGKLLRYDKSNSERIYSMLNSLIEEHEIENVEDRSFTNHLKRIDSLIELYKKNYFSISEYSKVRYPATYHFPCIPEDIQLLIDNEGPLDHINLIKRDESYFREIIDKSSIPFYDIIENTIRYIKKQAAIIEKKILRSDQFKDAMEKAKDSPKEMMSILKEAYLKEEFKRKEEVLPLLNEMRLLYQTTTDLIKGILTKYEAQKKK